MLSKPISTQVFEQPKLGEAAYKQAVAMKAKRDAKQEQVAADKQRTAEGLAEASAFMPLKHKQVAEKQFDAMEQAFVQWSKSNSAEDLAKYNALKTTLTGTMAVGKSKYDVANKTRTAAYNSGFDGIIGGQEAVDGQWDSVINSGYDSVDIDEYGNTYVTINGEKMPWSERPESDVREIRPGETDYVLQIASDVPKISTIVGAQSIYSPTLDENKSWSENWSKISEQIDVDMDSPDFPKAAAIFYYRKRKGGTGELTDTEVRKAVDQYVNNEKGAELAQKEWRKDLHDRMKQSFEQKEADYEDPTKGLSQLEKQIIDKPLNQEKVAQVMRPDGQTIDLDLYSQDVKSLKVPYDAAEGLFVDKVYYDASGGLDHFLIKVPKSRGSLDLSNIMSMDDVTVDDKSDSKYRLIRVYDPREFGNTFGERVSNMLSDKVMQATGQQYVRRAAGAGTGDDIASNIPMD